MPEPTVLFVDDDLGVLHALKRMLRREDYRILITESSNDGLTILDETPVQVVVSDYRMPGMTGVELLRQVKQRHPETVRAVISGYADAHAIMQAINEGEVYRFMPKPWNDHELKVTLRQCFEHYQLRQHNRELLQQVQQQNETLRTMNETLEHLVADRTRSLQLAQEILERLPMPVLGIDNTGTIVLANAAANTLAANDQPFMPVGLPMQAVLPPDVVQVTHRSLHERHAITEACVLFDHTMRVHATPLTDGADMRGSILLFEVTP